MYCLGNLESLLRYLDFLLFLLPGISASAASLGRPPLAARLPALTLRRAHLRLEELFGFFFRVIHEAGRPERRFLVQFERAKFEVIGKLAHGLIELFLKCLDRVAYVELLLREVRFGLFDRLLQALDIVSRHVFRGVIVREGAHEVDGVLGCIEHL